MGDAGKRAAQLRAALEAPGTVMLGGAHDALSARLVEQAGYAGVWASGYGISLASRCEPDLDLLTMTESVDAARRMAEAVDLPVLADGNAGYGGPVNVMRTVREYEAAGVAGVCIEDNPFPKRCSLYRGGVRELLGVAEMAAKVRAALAARRGSDFVVVARVESLIADRGVEEARDRATAYAEAGADAVLVHAKDFAPLRAFARSWAPPRRVPLVVVPTLFPDVPRSELEAEGFKVIIYPNQAARAAVRAMREVLEAMLAAGNPAAVDDRIVPLAEVNRLVRLDAVQAEAANA